MKIKSLLAIVSSFALFACSRSIPESRTIKLNLEPHGRYSVSINTEGNIPTAEEQKRFQWVIKNWPTLWRTGEEGFQKIIKDYNYSITLPDILRNPKNEIVLDLSKGGLDDKSNWALLITIIKPHGYHQFVCEFADTTISHCQPMF